MALKEFEFEIFEIVPGSKSKWLGEPKLKL